MDVIPLPSKTASFCWGTYKCIKIPWLRWFETDWGCRSWVRKTMTSLSGIASSSDLSSVEQTHQLIPLILVTSSSAAQSDTVGVCQALGVAMFSGSFCNSTSEALRFSTRFLRSLLVAAIPLAPKRRLAVSQWFYLSITGSRVGCMLCPKKRWEKSSLTFVLVLLCTPCQNSLWSTQLWGWLGEFVAPHDLAKHSTLPSTFEWPHLVPKAVPCLHQD